jgi:hypothetical protein
VNDLRHHVTRAVRPDDAGLRTVVNGIEETAHDTRRVPEVAFCNTVGPPASVVRNV